MTRALPLFIKDKSGAAATELALMLPLMLTVMFATFEAGNYFYTEQKIVEAVRQGARYAGRLPFSAYTCPGAVDNVVAGQIKNVTLTGSVSGSTPLIKDWEPEDIVITVSCNSGTTTGVFKANPGGAPIVTVAATAGYSSLFSQLVTGSDVALVRASAQSVVNGI